LRLRDAWKCWPIGNSGKHCKGSRNFNRTTVDVPEFCRAVERAQADLVFRQSMPLAGNSIPFVGAASAADEIVLAQFFIDFEITAAKRYDVAVDLLQFP
jgi:hypothetical protein